MEELDNHDLEKESNLKKIKDEVLNCQKCQLYKTRKYPVIGQGSHQAKICFIGEAPGANEDQTGRPFCGQSGKVFDELLNSVNIKREEVYITNILKCRPPNNRNPLENEIETCSSYLSRQLDLIKPKVICCLGNVATRFIMKKFGLFKKIEGIGKIHGQIFSVNWGNGSQLYIVPLYHPATVVYNANIKKILIKDFTIVKNIN